MSVETNSSVEWAIQMLDEAESIEEVRVILRSSARAAVRAQGATVIQRDGDQCYYADEDAMSPLWKGQRFPITSCISGWAMIHEQTVAVPDITLDARIPQDAYRPTFVRSLLMVPMRVAGGTPIGAIGTYWMRLHRPTEEEVATLERLAEAGGRALAKRLPHGGTAVRPGNLAGLANE